MGKPNQDLAVDHVEAGISMIPAVGPLLAPLGGRLARAVIAEQSRRSSLALKAAERLSGLSREDLEEAIAADPRLVPLVTRVLYSAGMTGSDAKLRVMGGVLGHAAKEPDQADRAEDLLAVVDDLREGHFESLAVAATDPPEVAGAAREWTQRLLENALRNRGEYMDVYLAGLTAAGLIHSIDALDSTIYRVTPLGRTLLAVLAELETEDIV